MVPLERIAFVSKREAVTEQNHHLHRQWVTDLGEKVSGTAGSQRESVMY